MTKSIKSADRKMMILLVALQKIRTLGEDKHDDYPGVTYATLADDAIMEALLS